VFNDVEKEFCSFECTDLPKPISGRLAVSCKASLDMACILGGVICGEFRQNRYVPILASRRVRCNIASILGLKSAKDNIAADFIISIVGYAYGFVTQRAAGLILRR
jgi:hypothetical protein